MSVTRSSECVQTSKVIASRSCSTRAWWVMSLLGAGDGVAQWPLALGREHDRAPQPVFVALPALQGGERAVDLIPLEQSRGQPDRHPGTARRHPLVDR